MRGPVERSALFCFRVVDFGSECFVSCLCIFLILFQSELATKL